MVLTIDVGNTQIEAGLMEGDKLVLTERFATDLRRTDTEYAVLLHSIFDIMGIRREDIEGAIIASVVPPLTREIRGAVRKITDIEPLVVGPGLKNGLNIKIDDPKTLGADIVVDAVAAIAIYGAPVIVIDMGTATTITYVDENQNYRGGAIAPGVKVSLGALANGTSQLPDISLEAPRSVIGTNTIDAMKSGIVFGQAAMVDGIVDKIHQEMKNDAKVVATGGLSKLVTPWCRNTIVLDAELMLKGLKIIYDRNL